MSKTPAFLLKQKVKITLTGQTGEVVGITQFVLNPTQYLIEHIDGQGNFAERWMLEDQIQASPVVEAASAA